MPEQLVQNTNPVAVAFSQHAKQYDRWVDVQPRIATAFGQWLAHQLQTTPLKHISEVACGTGLLTAELAQHWPNVQLHASDIAEGMVAIARHRLHPNANVVFSVTNAESSLPQPADLAVCCMAMHWFSNWQQTLHAWQQNTPAIALVLMGEGSLIEWQTLYSKEGVSSQLAIYPNDKVIRHAFRRWPHCTIEWHTFTETHASPWAFAQHLKRIGAGQSVSSQSVSKTFGFLKKLATAHQKTQDEPFTVTYRVAFVLAQQKAPN